MFIGSRIFDDCTHMNAAFMGKGAPSDERLRILRRNVCHFTDIIGKAGEVSEILLGQTSFFHFQLQIRNDRDQIGIAGIFRQNR